MSDDLLASTNLTRRGLVWHFCLRVPGDLVPAFGKPRVQFTLGTRDEVDARRRALVHMEEYRRRFAEIRAGQGRIDAPVMAGTRDTSAWTWSDWEALALWLEATLLEEDMLARMTGATGAMLLNPSSMPGRGHSFMVGTYELEDKLLPMIVHDYARDRLRFVQVYTGRLGVRVTPGPYFDRFMLACLQAELRVIKKMRAREVGQRGYEHAHPDEIAVRWSLRPAEVPAEATGPTHGGPSGPVGSGHSLTDCVAEWKADKARVSAVVTKHALADVESTVAKFSEHSGINDIASVTRKSVIDFRNHLLSQELATPTVNKKIGYLLRLSKQANRSGWIDTDLGRNYYLEVREGEDSRSPYSKAQLLKIFSHPLFTGGWRPGVRKALGEFSFWFPLISVMHGISTLEAGQLGPDTIGPHPDNPDILVFTITTAGGRTVKAMSRQRAIPIRRELLQLGIMDLVEDAKRANRRTIWSDAEIVGWPKASNYFSAFWTRFITDDVELEVEDQSLYSLRHSFQDAVSATAWAPLVKYMMGHAQGGMTDRYGRKRGPRVVPIEQLNEAIQDLSWPWLSNVVRPSLLIGSEG